jgi:hypothetical protein
MTATPQDVQAKLDAAATALTKTTKTYPAQVKLYGSDWTKWPHTSQWYIARKQISDARAEAGQLGGAPIAAFAYKEV